jgi:hypothetical protein
VIAARSALLLLAVVASGCGALLDGPPANRCATDGDCTAGTCDLERTMCVSEPPEAMRIGIEIMPATDPYGGTPLPVSFPPFEVTDRDFEVPLGVSVRGTVRDSAGVPVSAALTFTLTSEIPGVAPTRVETQTLAEPAYEGSEVFDYTVQLLPGRVYDVTVQPNGEWRSKLPPLRRQLESPREGRRIIQGFTWEGLERVEGVLVDAMGEGQAGLLVRAVDAASGRIVSSTYTTGSDPARAPGFFEIWREPSTEWLFSINASASRIADGNPSPTLTVAPSVLIASPDGLVTIQVPTPPQVISYGGFVEVAGSGGRGTAAALTFIARDVLDEATHVVGSFRAMVATSEEPGHEGEFTVQLLPGTYDVVITPTSPDLSVLREMVVRIDPEHGTEVLGQTFQVPARARYGGWVQTFDAEPMINAQVRGQARGSTQNGLLADVAVYARSSETLTDPDGRFNVPLDVGLYDIIVEPPSGTSWPWAIERDVANGGTGTGAVRGGVIELSPPVPLAGRALFAGGLPVAGGEIRAYGIVDLEDGSTRALQIGRAQTDAEGRFTLLLPSSF